MCEVESPLSLSGVLQEEPVCVKYTVGIMSLPEEVRVLILSQCSLTILQTLVTVCTDFYTIIRTIVSQVTHFEPESSAENTRKIFQLLLAHASKLKTLLGVCCTSGSPLLCSSDDLSPETRFECSPKQLFTLIKRNSELEHVVIYDFRIRDDEHYFDQLLQSLQSCTKLKLLYSESPLGHVTKVQEFAGQMKYLTEISFPNICTLKSTLETLGWFGYFTSNSGFVHPRNCAAIQVLRKGGKPEMIHSVSSPPSTVSVADRSKMAFGRAGLLRGGPSSLRESMGPSVPRRPFIQITSE